MQPHETSTITVNNDNQHQINHLNLQLKKANDERDEAIRKYELAKQEIEALKKTLLEINKHQPMIDALRQVIMFNVTRIIGLTFLFLCRTTNR